MVAARTNSDPNAAAPVEQPHKIKRNLLLKRASAFHELRAFERDCHSILWSLRESQKALSMLVDSPSNAPLRAMLQETIRMRTLEVEDLPSGLSLLLVKFVAADERVVATGGESLLNLDVNDDVDCGQFNYDTELENSHETLTALRCVIARANGPAQTHRSNRMVVEELERQRALAFWRAVAIGLAYSAESAQVPDWEEDACSDNHDDLRAALKRLRVLDQEVIAAGGSALPIPGDGTDGWGKSLPDEVVSSSDPLHGGAGKRDIRWWGFLAYCALGEMERRGADELIEEDYPSKKNPAEGSIANGS